MVESDFYDAFVSIRRGLFNTRSRTEHTRKRKIISHTFSPKSILEFEPYIKQNIKLFVKKWDSLIDDTSRKDGWAHIECLSWCKSPSLESSRTNAISQLLGV